MNTLIEEDRVRALRASPGGGYAVVPRLPENLAAKYAEIGHTDKTFDPFDYLLTLGPAEPRPSESPWSFDADVERGEFVLIADEDSLDEAWKAVRLIHPKMQLLVEREERSPDGRYEIRGQVVLQAGS